MSPTALAPAMFPDFAALTPDWYEWYQSRVYEFPQHCDFALNNLLVWLGGDSGVECAALEGAVVLRVSDSPVDLLKGTWLTVIGRDINERVLDLLLDQAPDHSLRIVPDYALESVRSRRYRIEEDEHNRDYIFDVYGLAFMAGRCWERFRYQVKRFERQYGCSASVRSVDLADPREADMLLESMLGWPGVSSFGPGGNDPSRSEEKAIRHLIHLQPYLPVKHSCLGVFLENRLRGFSIFHVPYSKDRIAIGNHIKYDASYERMFDYLVHLTACALKSDGISRINGDVDLGIEGLRQHKMGLRPTGFYRKYTVRRTASYSP